MRVWRIVKKQCLEPEGIQSIHHRSNGFYRNGTEDSPGTGCNSRLNTEVADNG